MLPSNATARTAQQTPIMISRITPPLQIDSDCRQASCHFDRSLFQTETPDRLNLTLPATLDSAVHKRKAEFIAGRYCARAALAQLDDNQPMSNTSAVIGIGANREPLWPPGVVGSITHTHDYAAAIVAPRSKVRALGLDSETWIDPGSVEHVSELILTIREEYTDHLHMFDSPLHYLTLVFSAKESLFKCLFPLVNRFFDFHAAVITPLSSGSTGDGEFRFELLEDLDGEFRTGYRGHGRYAILATHVHTAVILKPPTQDSD